MVRIIVRVLLNRQGHRPPYIVIAIIAFCHIK